MSMLKHIYTSKNANGDFNNVFAEKILCQQKKYYVNKLIKSVNQVNLVSQSSESSQSISPNLDHIILKKKHNHFSTINTII